MIIAHPPHLQGQDSLPAIYFSGPHTPWVEGLLGSKNKVTAAQAADVSYTESYGAPFAPFKRAGPFWSDGWHRGAYLSHYSEHDLAEKQGHSAHAEWLNQNHRFLSSHALFASLDRASFYGEWAVAETLGDIVKFCDLGKPVGLFYGAQLSQKDRSLLRPFERFATWVYGCGNIVESFHIFLGNVSPWHAARKAAA
jgi:hypothetical protein